MHTYTVHRVLVVQVSQEVIMKSIRKYIILLIPVVLKTPYLLSGKVALDKEVVAKACKLIP